MANPTIEKLRELFELLPDGRLVRRACPSNGARAGRVAGSLRKDGYLVVSINNTTYQCHRVVWALHTGAWPVGDIDHKDGNPSNNRPENLRDVNSQVNGQNRTRLCRNNTSGVHGVSWNKARSKWVANVQNPETKKRVFLGSFTSLMEAGAAVDDYRRRYYAGYSTKHTEAAANAAMREMLALA